MTDEVDALEHKLRGLDDRIRTLSRSVMQAMNEVVALWDLMVQLKKDHSGKGLVDVQAVGNDGRDHLETQEQRDEDGCDGHD